MRQVIHKLFWAWDFEEEEKWLNEMSAKGLHPVAAGWCKYYFDEGTPCEYTFKLEFMDNLPRSPESERYIRFIEDTGAEYLGSFFRWAYFRKKTSLGGFELFSDIGSRMRHLNRILLLLGAVMLLDAINAFNNLFQFFSSGLSISLIACILCASLSLLLLYGFIRIYRKRLKLSRDSLLQE